MEKPTIHNPGLISWILLIILSAIWGASFMNVSIALESFPPLTLAALRIFIAAVCLTLIAFMLGYGLPSLSSQNGLKIWLHCLGMGLFSNILPFSMLSWGQQFVSSGFAGISMAVVPLLVLPLSFFFILEEKFHKRKLFGFIFGFIGVLILIGPNSILKLDGDFTSIARVACLGASFCYAVGAIITRRSPEVSLISFAAAALILSSIIIIPLALTIEGIPQHMSVRSFLAVSYLGLMPTAIATILLVRIIQTAGPAFYSLANYQVPVWSIIFGVVILNENLPIQFFIAFLLILTGLLITQAKTQRSKT